MLAKLLKYDFMYSKNGFFAMAVALIGGSVVFGIGLDVLMNMGIFSLTLFLLATVFMTGVSVACLVLVYQNFAKSLFSDHGYLMFTLPVKRETLLLTKLITSQFWLNFMVVVYLAMYAIMIFFENIRNPHSFPTSMFGSPDMTELVLMFTYLNIIGFMLICMFFAMISLSKSYVKGRKVHWVLSIVAGIVYFITWIQTVDWFFDNVAPFGEFGMRFGRVDGHWGYWYRAEYDFFLLGSAIAFGLLAYFATLHMLKRTELR